MNPAPSIIVFTTGSGLGYGMLFLLALGAFAGLLPAERWFGLTGLIIALLFVTGGLISSTFHLAHPERARLALSQWRSSWLSREGLAALLTYPPALILGVSFAIFEEVTGILSLMALATAFGAFATVFCTGMIYASLPPIPAWHHSLTAPTFLGFALMTGALAIHFLLISFHFSAHWAGYLALVAIVVAFGLKLACWKRTSKDEPKTTIESATGLGRFGLVRMLDPPPTQTNYLLHEMGFVVGRKHASRLRMLTIFFGLFGSLMFSLLALVFESWPKVLFAFLALLSGMVGVLLERWLFFAEAKHTAMLYYGGPARLGTAVTPANSQHPEPIKAPQRRPVSASISRKPSR